jgi:hypothetical protein
MIVGKGMTKVDLDYFVCGTSWEQCREPIVLS